MTVTLLAPHWASNTRIQRAANNNLPISRGDPDKAAVTLLQQALITCGFPMKAGADGAFGSQTAAAVITAEAKFGFELDNGIAGREVIGALDLTLRGWNSTTGPWGGQLARTIVPLAQRKIGAALTALAAVQAMLATGGFDFVTADGVTMAALQVHFKLVPPGGAIPPGHEPITRLAIDQIVQTFRGVQRTLATPSKIRHSICTLGLDTAAEATFGGQILFGPPYSTFAFGDVAITNIDVTGPHSLAAMMIHEGTHVVDLPSGEDAIHISEFTPEYESQSARNARHNPSAYATFAAHIFENGDRPRNARYGLSENGRKL